MCGIAGIVGADNAVAELAVERMVGVMARRGPDAQGLVALPGAVLGHRRLSIFDLSDAGAQPMSSTDRKLWVVFNGAIYNFKALRAELAKLGCCFRSDSDTEVLLHGYRAWGIERLARRLRGMFAFGLWDAPARTLYLVRDRLGVKPLVFAVANREFAFASTVRALERGGYAGEIDDRALLDILHWGFVGEQHCIYRGVFKVPAATILEWSGGSYRENRYWHAPQPHKVSALSFGDAVAEVERRLREAVALRLEADVPVAALLSGGIDSSLVCWAIADLGADLTAYTIGVPGDPWDESAAAVSTARRLGIRHCVLGVGDGQMPDPDDLLSAYDEPFPSSSALGMLCISRAIRASAKVVITGDGGDDLFLGYPRHRHLWLAEKLSRCVAPGLAEAWKRRGPKSLPAPLRRAGALLDYATGGADALLKKSAALTGYCAKGLLGARFKEAARARVREEYSARCASGIGMVEDLVSFERGSRFVGEYLKKVDGATMYYAIEARSPFLDQELWDFACALPVDLRLRRGELKAILRALARRHLGIGAASRKKRGFRIPARRWLVRHWLERAEHVFDHSVLAGHGWLDKRTTLAELRRAARAGTAGDELWNLFVLESWLQSESRERDRRPEPNVGTQFGSARESLC
jgi:asparagine synthase (glutamine-hydrolysing)